MPVTIRATEKGLQEAAGWPKPGAAGGEVQVAALLRLLDERIADEGTSEEDRGRLRRVREALTSASFKVIGDVLGRFLVEMAKGGAAG